MIDRLTGLFSLSLSIRDQAGLIGWPVYSLSFYQRSGMIDRLAGLFPLCLSEIRHD